MVISIEALGNNSLCAVIGMGCFWKKCPVLPVSAMVLMKVGKGGPTESND